MIETSFAAMDSLHAFIVNRFVNLDIFITVRHHSIYGYETLNIHSKHQYTSIDGRATAFAFAYMEYAAFVLSRQTWTDDDEDT
jgi:hypothetical protein